MVACHGSLIYPGVPSSPHPRLPSSPPQVGIFKLPAPKGTYYTLLQGTTLHLHRGNPYRMSDEQDGAEVARLKLLERGWTKARRFTGKDGICGVELYHDKGIRKTVSKKSSLLGLGRKEELTGQEKEKSSFAGKMMGGIRSKRTKSISSSQSLYADAGGDGTIPDALLLVAESESAANHWVDCINSALSMPPPLPLSNTSNSQPNSIPVSPSLPHFPPMLKVPPRGSARSTVTNSTSPIFNTSRRPSFLDRPPPSPRSYVTVLEAPPAANDIIAAPTSPNEASVPAWLKAVKTAASSATSIVEPIKTLKPKSSVSSLGALRPITSTLESHSRASMESSASRPESSTGTGGRKLLGFLGKKSRKDQDLHATLANYTLPESSSPPMSPTFSAFPGIPAVELAPPPPTSRTYSATISSAASLSESHSTSACSSEVHLPLTPDMAGSSDFGSHDTLPSTLPARTTSPITPRRNGTTRSTESQVSGFASVDSRRSTVKSSSEGRASVSSHSTYTSVDSEPTEQLQEAMKGKPPTRVGATGMSVGRRVVSSRKAEWTEFEATSAPPSTTSFPLPSRDRISLLSSRASSPPIPNGIEHIISPRDLISQMANESGRTFGGSQVPVRKAASLAASTSSQSSSSYRHVKSPSFAGLGGLSPPPRSMSRSVSNNTMGERTNSRSSLSGLATASSSSTLSSTFLGGRAIPRSMSARIGLDHTRQNTETYQSSISGRSFRSRHLTEDQEFLAEETSFDPLEGIGEQRVSFGVYGARDLSAGISFVEEDEDDETIIIGGLGGGRSAPSQRATVH